MRPYRPKSPRALRGPPWGPGLPWAARPWGSRRPSGGPPPRVQIAYGSEGHQGQSSHTWPGLLAPWGRGCGAPLGGLCRRKHGSLRCLGSLLHPQQTHPQQDPVGRRMGKTSSSELRPSCQGRGVWGSRGAGRGLSSGNPPRAGRRAPPPPLPPSSPAQPSVPPHSPLLPWWPGWAGNQLGWPRPHPTPSGPGRWHEALCPGVSCSEWVWEGEGNVRTTFPLTPRTGLRRHVRGGPRT